MVTSNAIYDITGNDAKLVMDLGKTSHGRMKL